MKVTAIPLSELFAQSNDIYQNVVIASKRARKLVENKMMEKRLEESMYDDGTEIPLKDPEEFIETEKPIVVSLEELLHSKLEWSEHPSGDILK